MQRFRIGAWVITLIGLFTMFSAYAADWNETHIYNPRWPPHAKFHNAQTMAFAALLGALALYFLWLHRKRNVEEARTNLTVTVIFAALYWVAQALAFLFPGIASFDPEFAATAPPRLLGMPGQLTIDLLVFVLLGASYVYERWRLNEPPTLSTEPSDAQQGVRA